MCPTKKPARLAATRASFSRQSVRRGEDDVDVIRRQRTRRGIKRSLGMQADRLAAEASFVPSCALNSLKSLNTCTRRGCPIAYKAESISRLESRGRW